MVQAYILKKTTNKTLKYYLSLNIFHYTHTAWKGKSPHVKHASFILTLFHNIHFLFCQRQIFHHKQWNIQHISCHISTIVACCIPAVDCWVSEQNTAMSTIATLAFLKATMYPERFKKKGTLLKLQVATWKSVNKGVFKPCNGAWLTSVYVLEQRNSEGRS